eukprot:4403943-Pyramimonas_sp.AAC.1
MARLSLPIILLAVRTLPVIILLVMPPTALGVSAVCWGVRVDIVGARRTSPPPWWRLHVAPAQMSRDRCVMQVKNR